MQIREQSGFKVHRRYLHMYFNIVRPRPFCLEHIIYAW
jgi:hypothetical protein